MHKLVSQALAAAPRMAKLDPKMTIPCFAGLHRQEAVLGYWLFTDAEDWLQEQHKEDQKLLQETEPDQQLLQETESDQPAELAVSA